MDISREDIAQVPSLFQLTLSSISNISLWSFSCDDVPETAVPGLLEKIKQTDFDLDLLPNFLPASLQYLDLTGYSNLTEDTLLVIIKKCFCITDLILNDVPLITESIVPKIFWNLPDLRYLSLGAGVGSLSMLEVVQGPIKLLYLEINSASMDEMWLEQLRYFPDLISLKLRNVSIPKSQPFKLPPNLAIVDITTSYQKVSDDRLNLFTFFMTNAPSLREFAYGGKYRFSAEEIGPIVANDLRVLQAKSKIKVSKAVVDVISDTCHNLEEVSDLLLITSQTDTSVLGEVAFPTGGTEKIHFRYTTKKLNTDYSGITSESAWEEGPTRFYVPPGTTFVLPIDPCQTLKHMELTFNGALDIVDLLQLFPNLEVLDLRTLTLNLAKQPTDVNQVLGSKLKRLALRSLKIATGTIDLFAKSKSLKKVTLTVDKIEEYAEKAVQFDELLVKFPFVEKMKLLSAAPKQLTITNRKNGDAEPQPVEDHPLKYLYFSRELNTTDTLIVESIDFNRYKHLQLLSFEGTYLGHDTILHTKLKALLVNNIQGLYKTTFKLPETLYCLKWESPYLHDDIMAAIPKMKKLGVVQFASQFSDRVSKVYGNNLRNTAINGRTLKYFVPRRQEVTKTNLLSAFSGIKQVSSPTEKLHHLLESSGSNLSIPELQLIAEMYSRQEISLRSDLPVVHVKIRLTSGAVMNINCNPIHRVIDLYAYARHAVKLGDKAFDLVIPPKQVLDLSTYDKTVQELRLANTTLIQKIREATPVENELRSFGLFHSRLINFNKTSSAGISNQQEKPLKKSDAAPVNNNNNTTSHVDAAESPDDDMSDESYGSESDMDESEQGPDDEEDTMAISDDDDLDMYFVLEKDEKKEEITAENKHLLDQLNAETLRMSREHHAQNEREENEEVRRKYEAEQRRIEDERMRQFNERLQHQIRNNLQPVNQAPQITAYQPPQPVNFVPAQQVNPLNNAEFMTDEEMARMLQEEEYFQGNF
jgi:hypothetical protein